MTSEISRVSAWVRTCAIAAGVMALAAVSSAQSTITSTDIQRLQDQVYQASSDISRMGTANGRMASDLQSQLDDLRDEVVYLKVKLRKEGNVSTREFGDVRDRIQTLQRPRTRRGAAGRAPGVEHVERRDRQRLRLRHGLVGRRQRRCDG